MRVTTNLTYSTYMNDIMRRQESILETTKKLSSGKRVMDPSDDPAAAESIMTSRSVLSGLDQYARNIDSGLEYLGAAEQALSGVQSAMARLRELATSGASNTVSAESKANIAKEVRALNGHLIALANSNSDGRYIFSGYKTDTVAFTAAGTYQGDANKSRISIGDDATLTIGVNGAEVFKGTAGGVDLFTEVSDLAVALEADDMAGVQAAISSLETGQGQISDALSDVGANMTRLQASKDSTEAFKNNLLITVSQQEDADVTKLIYELKVGQSALEAAISAANNVLNINIFNYL